MGRKICLSCNSSFDDQLLKQKNSEVCLICGAPLLDESETQSESAPEEEMITWYYYALPKAGYYLSNELLDDKNFYRLEYEFQAPNDKNKAKEILRKYDPTAFAPVKTKPDPVPRCPQCGSTAITIVPRKFSILTGFRTNRVDRVCINCRHKW